MDRTVPSSCKLRHSVTQDTYHMRFGPAAARFVRDGEPLSSIFTNHGRPRQVSIAYPAGTDVPAIPNPDHWDSDPQRPDWAYGQRRHFVEIE
jgi:hypothetical protein